ncbi:hypothetical protein EYS42_16865 [Aquabacterium lacunae]|uniref:Uncharacterized protein n=1 Tax=Aquabacterium lacunae TaxID=2528630 RepID=A0A4V2JF98_9BURK|nr:hypothetical protein EYS42_16865 [Aquabacterium lacunae]
MSRLPKNLAADENSVVTVGSIKSQRYFAAHVNAGDETQEGFKPVLVLTRTNRDNTYEPFKLIELSSFSDLSVQIKDGAIYIRRDVAHHGTYFTNYKFMPSGASFRLVAMETQSITPVQYDGVNEHIVLWEGASVNFLASRVTYWAKAFEMNEPKEQRAWQQALKQHQSGVTPSVRARRTVRISHVKASQLDIQDFDPGEFNTDFLCCYFDHRLRFHNTCQ